MVTRNSFILALLFLAAAACASSMEVQPARAPRIDSAAMLSHVSVLAHDSLGGRPTGSPGGIAAREYIKSRFTQIGLEPVGASLVHEFVMSSGGTGTASNLSGFNVVGIIRGTANPGKFIVVTAHYDHLSPRNGQIMNGADDNASGTGALLALAAWFKRNPPRTSIVFAALDAEERGLRGARAFVDAPTVPLDSIVLNVNMDMVGRNDKDELYVTGTLHYPFLKAYIERVQPSARVKLLMGHDEGRGSDNWTSASDHGAFHGKRIPFLYFGVEDHADYHQHTDEFSRLMPGFYVRAIETVLDVLLLLDADATIRRSDGAAVIPARPSSRRSPGSNLSEK